MRHVRGPSVDDTELARWLGHEHPAPTTGTMSETGRLLLVDDDADDRALASLVLKGRLRDVAVQEVPDATSFAEHLAAGGFAVAIVSACLTWGDGLRVVHSIRRRVPDCLLLLLVPSGSTIPAERATELGLAGWLPKDSRGFLALPELIRGARSGATATANDIGFRQLAEAIPVGVFSLSVNGTVIYANGAAAEMLGAPYGRVLAGRPAASLFPGVDLQRRWSDLLAEGRRLEGIDAHVRLGDGQRRRLRIHAWPVAGPRGQVTRHDGTVQDLSAFEEIERELDRRTVALQRSNEELEQLAYALSHDLQEPLQLVTRHARLLRERYGDRLEQGAERYLGHLVTNSERMQAMLDDALSYLHSAGAAASPMPVDFGAAVDEAVTNLAVIVEEAGAQVRHNLLPTLPADRRQIVQLFQNLISNALKFRADRAPRVVITAKEREGDWCFAVKDNGIGMLPELSTRIFGLFQRLHTAEEYPGTGIGLAICKRIVEGHGGQIWVSSQPGQGSTFFLSVPKAASSAPPPAVPGQAYERTDA
jgi:PAS domain S-box-containing protein